MALQLPQVRKLLGYNQHLSRNQLLLGFGDASSTDKSVPHAAELVPLARSIESHLTSLVHFAGREIHWGPGCTPIPSGQWHLPVGGSLVGQPQRQILKH